MEIRNTTSKDIQEIVELNSALFKEDVGTRDDFVSTSHNTVYGAWQIFRFEKN